MRRGGEIQQRVDPAAQPLRGPHCGLRILPLPPVAVRPCGEQVLQRGEQEPDLTLLPGICPGAVGCPIRGG